MKKNKLTPYLIKTRIKILFEYIENFLNFQHNQKFFFYSIDLK
jgi:hypothetical protein